MANELLELGGGTIPRPGYLQLDMVHGSTPELTRRVQDTPWPVADESMQDVYCSHLLEHIPAGPDRIGLFNEVHRVLRPGGTFTIICPLIGYTDPATGRGTLVETWQPYADPTHVSGLYFPETLLYFCPGAFAPNADYGIRRFATLQSWSVESGWEGHATLVR